mmetsp:Transcript_7819/g.16832  ORF Transcript_7819/g.16832 Transcript_7819/m.16832 type:complete len:300 (+) Transcript_7819:1-900(+)
MKDGSRWRVHGSDLERSWWTRWVAARRELSNHDFLLVVDPDTFVFPSCFFTRLEEAFSGVLQSGSQAEVFVRDIRDGEDLNNGVAMVRSSEGGHLFLDLLVSKERWPSAVAGPGPCMYDQSAFYEALLELMAAAGGTYRGECSALWRPTPRLFTTDGLEAVSFVCNWEGYTVCWRYFASKMVSEGVNVVEFVKVEVADVNYRPIGNEARYHHAHRQVGRDPDIPIEHTAFIWHYVNHFGSKWPSMQGDWGLPSLEVTRDCSAVRALAKVAAQHRQQTEGRACRLSGPGFPCWYSPDKRC